MGLQIIFTEKAFKDLAKLNNDEKQRIKSKLIEYSENPLFFAKKLSNFKLGNYRFRIGDYRVICDIEENIIIILRVGHRKEIYK